MDLLLITFYSIDKYHELSSYDSFYVNFHKIMSLMVIKIICKCHKLNTIFRLIINLQLLNRIIEEMKLRDHLFFV